jgi:probable rRNA maturation factor
MLTKPAADVTDLVNFLKGELGIAEATAVDVTFVDEDAIAELHMRYMGLPGPTDVLSFPATDVAHGPVDPTNFQGEPTLGDIVICPVFIARNTRSKPTQISVEECVIHGMLHLLGYDHQKEPDAKRMSLLEEQLKLKWAGSGG